MLILSLDVADQLLIGLEDELKNIEKKCYQLWLVVEFYEEYQGAIKRSKNVVIVIKQILKRFTSFLCCLLWLINKKADQFLNLACVWWNFCICYNVIPSKVHDNIQLYITDEVKLKLALSDWTDRSVNRNPTMSKRKVNECLYWRSWF